MIEYLEQPSKTLDGVFIIIGGDEEGEFKIEFTDAEKAWDYYFKNKPL